MEVFRGYVRVKETNEPIPDLVIALRAQGAERSPGKGGASASDPMKRYSLSLGSTITDAHGAFQIDLDSAKETPPSELMLAVLGPFTGKAAANGESSSSSRRLLYWTEIPKPVGSRSETFVIRLLEEQLEAEEVRPSGRRRAHDAARSAAQIVEAQQTSAQFRQALRAGLGPIRREMVARRREVTEAARRFVAPLQATAPAARARPHWVASGADSQAAMQYAVEEGLARLAQAAVHGSSRTLVIAPDDAQLVAAGIPEPSRVTVQGLEIDHEQLCTLLHARRGGTQAIRVRGLLEGRRQAAQAEARLQGESTNGGSPPAEAEPPEEEVDPVVALRRRVLGQLRDMPVGDLSATEASPTPLTAEELNALLPSLRLGAGPADTPAFHDFHHLNIAFPHVWTEAFDGQLKENVERLYDFYVQLHDEFGVDFVPPTELTEAQEMHAFLKELEGAEQSLIAEPVPPEIHALMAHFDRDLMAWFHLSPEQRAEILGFFNRGYMDGPRLNFSGGMVTGDVGALRSVREHLDNPQGILTRLQRLRLETAVRLNEPYAFHYFAPDTVNFGLLTTYRQLWTPGPYQVGDLVSTIPLAPGEKRKYSTRQVVKRSRAETEVSKSLASRSRELTTTRRVEAEIAARASQRSNFQMTSEGSFRFAIGEISSGSEFSLDKAEESSQVKRDFREAVLKAAQEYREERSLKVATTDEQTLESTASGELSNPNNELTVTYLLYELERQYQVSERIHRVTPVVLVAQDVPAPHEITESWLLSHEWILRRVLLDDGLIPALDHLSDAFAGDELSVSIRQANWKLQRELVARLQVTINELLSARDRFRTSLIASEESLARAEAAEEAQGWLTELLENLTVGDSGEMAVAEMEAKVKSLQKQLDYVEEGLGEQREELALSREALDEATRAYTTALETQLNRRVAIDQLRMHVKQNILYYMQAIWDHEPPDQRFFRLYHIEVALPESPSRTCTLRRATEEEMAAGLPFLEREGRRYVIEGCEPPTLPMPGDAVRKPLVAIADLDHPLGYKGNYMMFPLKTCVYLTDFMMREYFDDYFGIHDPDPGGNFTAEELLTYTEELLREGTVTSGSDAWNELRLLIQQQLSRPRRDSDLIVVPTGELFAEALLGEHPLLETFKLNHRFYDLAKARAEWREEELENLRRAARLLQEEPDLDDPEIDHRVVVEGASEVHVDTP